ncbi:roadblock/LC7 domain-containing protein [Streptomyces gamaensis]|uniref:Roadblock/LC7 domain-containing protein n=1 Tax=Streptomyces gamaensis TaxID=1763542 RepID=A0ABW0ZAA4_9ACTN
MTAPKAATHTATHATAHTTAHPAAPATAPGGAGGLTWLLDDLVDRVGSVREALVLSGDGLATGASKHLAREDAEHLAAVASGFHSLAKGVGHRFDAGDVRQTVVELDGAFLFVTAAGEGSALAVLADANADIGLVAYEMTLLVKRVGAHLATAPRSGAADG